MFFKKIVSKKNCFKKVLFSKLLMFLQEGKTFIYLFFKYDIYDLILPKYLINYDNLIIPLLNTNKTF
jgi:hypothetical protein